MTVTLYEVGGCVRDELLGIPTKDVDYVAVVSSLAGTEAPFDYLRCWLTAKGFTVFVETPQFLTIRAHFPKGWDFAGRDCSRLTADFVLARKESDYTDGRRPDRVIPGTLQDDLARRDFTVNAMAKDKDGNVIDLYNGWLDLRQRILRCVGNPEDRIREDALRALRAIRFEITKGIAISDDLWNVLYAGWLPKLVANVSADRRRDELHKCFKHDTVGTMKLLTSMRTDFVDACFADDLWLMPTLKGK